MTLSHPSVGSHGGRSGLTRRGLLRSLLATGGTLLLAGACAGYMYELEPRWLSIERVSLSLPFIPPAFHGLRIAHLSDLHRGPLTELAVNDRSFDMALSLAPDLVVLTGDFVSERAEYALELVPLLARLAVAPFGVLGVLGNHDHWTDVDYVAAQLRAAGVRVLLNEATPLVREGQTLWLAGVDDVPEGRADLPRALAPVPRGAPVILLAHEPDFADSASEHGVLLQLSGHSHGGKVRLPGVGAPVLPDLGRKYPQGLNRAGETFVYTNRGVGSTPMGMRFNCRPEVTLFTLASGAA